MDYDFIAGFTLFTAKGFRTMYRHFDKLDTAKRFVSNVNIKDNSKIYVDLKYMQDKIKAKIEELEDLLDLCNGDSKIAQYKKQMIQEEIADFKELLEKE